LRDNLVSNRGDWADIRRLAGYIFGAAWAAAMKTRDLLERSLATGVAFANGEIFYPDDAGKRAPASLFREHAG